MNLPVKKWADILTIVSGKNQKAVTNPNGQYPIYGSGGIMGYADDYLCEAGTTIVGRKGTINNPIFVAERFWNVDTAFGITPGEELNPKFLYYFCRHFNFKALDKSTTIPSLTKRDLLAIEMPVPSLTEQERIVARIEELFSELDNGVETLRKTKHQLIKYRRSVIKYELEKDNPGVFWNDTCVSIVCDCLDNRRKPVKKDKRSSGEGKYPYYGANGQTGTIDDYLFDEELVLVVEDETFIGRIKPFSYVISGKTWVNNHAHILRGKIDVMDNHYLNYLLSYYPFLPMTTGTTGRKKLTKAALLSAPIHICDYEHQKEVVKVIDAKLSVCDEIEKTVDTALQQAEAMRQSILNQAFEGKL